jgi:hypothetical protein
METKICNKCKLPSKDFPIHQGKESRRCKECHKANRLAWSRANKDKVKKSASEWYKRNTEQALTANKKWQKENKERTSEVSKVWKSNNRAKVNEYRRTCEAKNPELYRAIKQKSTEKCKNNHREENNRKGRERNKNINTKFRMWLYHKTEGMLTPLALQDSPEELEMLKQLYILLKQTEKMKNENTNNVVSSY